MWGLFKKKKRKSEKQRSERTIPLYQWPERGDGSISPPPNFSTTYCSPSELYDQLPKLLDTPWRKLDWSKRDYMKNCLRSVKTSCPDVKYLRILVHGPVGAGKSSFINSIDSIFQERMTTVAIADAVTDHSFTKTFQTHNIKDQRYDSFLPFAFCDIMGLEDGHSEGVETEDLIKALQGHIKEDYLFNPASPCSDGELTFRSGPSLSQKIHCLVSVIPASSISRMDDALFSKMKEVRAKAALMKIPQVAVLTKVDQACPQVTKDIKHVYRSKKIKDKMQECQNKLGVPMNCIFPVKNYSEEIDLNNEVDVLLLSALKHILNYANDHVAVMAKPPAHHSAYQIEEAERPPANMDRRSTSKTQLYQSSMYPSTRY